MVGQSRADAGSGLQQRKEFRDFQLRADVEIGVFIGAEKFKQIPPRPGGDIKIFRHVGIVA